MRSLSVFKARLSAHCNGHMVEIVRGAVVAFALKVSGAAINFGFSVLLARILGAEEAGVYYLALTISTVVWMVGCFGLENSLLKYVSANAARSEWTKVKGVYNKAIILGSLVSFSLSISLFFLAPFLAESVFFKPSLEFPLKYMALAVLPMTMVLLHSEAIKGIKRIRDSQIINGVAVPVFSLLGLSILGQKYGVPGVSLLYLAAAIIAAIAGRMIWVYATPQLANMKAEFSGRALISTCMPLLVVSISYMVIQWSATFALGVWGTNADVGIYSIALRTANLTSFVLLSVNSIVAPKFSELYSCGKLDELAETARKSTLLMLLIASPILFVFLLVPNHVMAIFGPGFKDSGYILSIISVGQFVNVATGSVAYLLVMTGREVLMRNNAVFMAVFAVILNLILVPLLGVLGAAIASAISMAMINLISLYLVWKSLKIITIPYLKL